MAVKYKQDDCTLPYTPGSAVTGGDVVVQNGLVGVALRDIASGVLGAVQIEGVFNFPKATGALSAGQKVYWDSANSNVSRLSSVGPLVGSVVTAVVSGATTVDVLLMPNAHKSLAFSAEAASTAVSNTATETTFDQKVTLAANLLAPGDVVRVRLMATATATHSTDTWNVKLYLGSIAIVATGAIDAVDGHVAYIDADIVIRTDGASGTLVAAAVSSIGVANSATLKPTLLASTAVDTTAAMDVKATATWSVADTGNSCRLDVMNVEVLKK